MTLTLHPDVSLAETDDGAVLLHQRTGRYWQLNPTGVLVLRNLLDGRSHDQAAQELATRHRAAPDAAQRDVTRLVESLREARLVVESR
ncbi:lasso peptide biosynthesis PqqD family chaperone [Streptomyces flavofungini]|uniref:lasso peptide biosynthesis PqqD family chaperone n=1 Tax=Streptomyces flavofungini TaxID=68200 RepID=UPI0025AFFC89|nr:lasso peptide biosynthesis PqqD family chaperone [Streptomyces flavofungini]WJV44469.1 lasso peptide biosynthesis PqqD family chaperone [Streptomyces flavofungini]